MLRSVIIGTGSYLPEVKITNKSFSNAQFFEKDGTKMYKSNAIVIRKFQEITGIAERRYAKPEQQASDLAYLAAKDAITSSGVDPESFDYIIVAHNFGDVASESNRVNIVPSIASRAKALLQIQNPDCVAYDIAFGCPGWIEAAIQANYFIRSGDAKRCLVIGTETLSRVTDPHDRDSMIYSDGSAAVILEASANENEGIISHKTQTYANDHSALLNMGKSYSPFRETKDDLFIKMDGRKVYEFVLNYLPQVIQESLRKAGVSFDQVKKVLVHQANTKMNQAVLERLFKLNGKEFKPDSIMPMTIEWLGNSSVATVPTLLDQILKGKIKDQKIQKGDYIVMASVGAGMNLNSIVYRM
jgi:3-oxoacyl-[acyl-carrier-protein] synthase III